MHEGRDRDAPPPAAPSPRAARSTAPAAAEEPPARAIECAPGFDAALAREAIARHAACLRGGPGAVLKCDAHSRVTRVELASGRALVVKEYAWRGLGHRLKDAIRRPPPEREWRAAGRLARAGVAVARPLARVAAPLSGRASAYLVAEAARGERADHAVARLAGPAARRRRRALLTALADYLRALHAARVWHGDMKPSNVLAEEADGGWRFVLVDLADVRVGRRVGYARRVESLAQLNAATPLAATASDRLRFLRRYAGGDPALGPLERLWRDVWRATRERKCVWDPDYGVPGPPRRPRRA